MVEDGDRGMEIEEGMGRGVLFNFLKLFVICIVNGNDISKGRYMYGTEYIKIK